MNNFVFHNPAKILFGKGVEKEAAREIRAGDEVRVDFDTGVIENRTTGKTYQAQPFPPFIQNIIEKGGLLNSIRDKM